jgi:alcohol dehydrogenase class IV
LAEIARILTGDPAARPENGVAWVKALVADLDILPLSAYGINVADIPELVTKSKAASSMKGNPVPLQDDTLAEILAGVMK